MGLVSWWRETRAVGRIQRDIVTHLATYPSHFPADGRTEREKGELAALSFGLSVWSVDRRRISLDLEFHSTIATPRYFGDHHEILDSPEYQAGVIHGQRIVTEIVHRSGFVPKVPDAAFEETLADWLELAVDRPMVPFADRLQRGPDTSSGGDR